MSEMIPETSPDATPLSAAGLARKQVIMRDLCAAVRSRAARRAHTRRIVGVASCMLVLTTAALALSTLGPSRAGVRIAERPVPPAPPGPSRTAAAPVMLHASFARVQTDPGLANRVTVRARTHRAEIISDEELLDALSAAGRPSGLIRTGNRVILTGAIAEEQPAEEPTPIGGVPSQSATG